MIFLYFLFDAFFLFIFLITKKFLDFYHIITVYGITGLKLVY